jgi:endonuclease YncB( thermonuclease family)
MVAASAGSEDMGGLNNAPRGGRSGWWRPSVVFAVLAVGFAVYTAVQPEPEAPQDEPIRAQAAVVSQFSGVATVSDGDTLRIGDRRIQLDGIVAPQRSVRCGGINVYRAATDALREVTRSEHVVCQISDLPGADGHDVAECNVEDVSLNEYMVANGWARDWPRQSGGAYADAEAAARAARRGLWGLSCPADLWSGTALAD